MSQLLQEAQQALQQQNWLKWQSLARQAISQEQDYWILRQLAGLASQAQDWEHCAHLLRRAVAVYPTEGTPQVSLQQLQDERLRICYQAGYHDEALVILSQNLADLPVLPTDNNAPIELPAEERQRFARALSERGLLYVNLNRDQEGLEDWLIAARLDPDNVAHWVNIGRLLEKHRSQESQNTAKMAYIKAVTLAPEMGAVWNSLGNVYLEHDELEHAAQAYQNAADNGYNNAKLKLNQALLHWQQGQATQALHELHQLVQEAPDDARVHYNRAMLRLLHGEIREGFAEHEAWRHKVQHPALARTRHKGLPMWEGQKTKHLLLSCEQGFGDNIQFIRYLTLLRDRAERITLECYAELFPLFAQLKGLDPAVQLIRFEDPLPQDIDTWCPLIRLPYIAQTDASTTPAPVPYFETQESWHSPAEITVGCVWAPGVSNELADIRRFHQRLVPVKHFSRLSELYPQISFVDLQRQSEDCPPAIQALPGAIESFADTAYYLKGLDLLISVDTATAHLAGALNVPTWLLLADRSDWRWMLERSDTPWYPSMRLFRQRQRGEWADVFVALQNALNDALESGQF